MPKKQLDDRYRGMCTTYAQVHTQNFLGRKKPDKVFIESQRACQRASRLLSVERYAKLASAPTDSWVLLG